MMRQLRSFAAWGAIAALALVVNTAPAHAQGAMDTPALSVVKSNRAEVTVRITAGPSGAPGGIYLEWMNWDAYDANGGWATDIYGGLYYCEFTGVPTWHVGSYQLGPGESVDVVLGALFDETGVGTDWTDEMPEGGHFVVRARAEGSGTTAESPNTPTLEAFTAQDPNNCTFTQGFWKTHPGVWPVGSLTLGTVSYTAAQLLSIFNTPAGGNGLLVLAHQLIAAKLNIANGADGSAINSTIVAADALIGGLVCPPVGSGFLSPASTNSLTNTLDDWNNGVTGPGHCGNTPTKQTTWGRLKSLYR
jgi:hypothetical protein